MRKKSKAGFPAVFALVIAACLWPAGCSGGAGGEDGAADAWDADADMAAEWIDMPADGSDMPPEDADGPVDVPPDTSVDDAGAEDGREEEPGGPIAWEVADLGIEAVAHDIARDNTGAVHIIWKQDNMLHYGRIESGALEGGQDVPDSARVFTRSTRPRPAGYSSRSPRIWTSSSPS
ncbi:MAG: hypothetical protein ABIJ56_19815 [Pseudomonadota bacterium]